MPIPTPDPKPKLRLLNPERPNATLILTDGTTKTIQPENKHDFKLKELKALLNCDMIEVTESYAVLQPYQSNHDHILIIDEEGKLKNKPRNELATEWYNDQGIGDFIVGDAILCHTLMLE